MANEKPKIAIYWCASCGGCEEAVVDLHEDILMVANALEFVFWPVALDFKYKDIEEREDGEITISLINGSIRTSEQEKMAKLLRKKSKVVVAFGSCAHLGGIPGLANVSNRKDILDYVYKIVPSTKNPANTLPTPSVKVPGGEITIPEFHDRVSTLDQVIKVDYYLPGCPPPPDSIKKMVVALLNNQLPPAGSVLAPDIALCDTCPKKATKSDLIKFKELQEFHNVVTDPKKCFLEDGVICMGPVTRSGCGERCINVNIPCRGCFGPMSNIQEQGAKFISAMGMTLDENDEANLDKVADSFKDMIGTMYQYSLAASFLKGKKKV